MTEPANNNPRVYGDQPIFPFNEEQQTEVERIQNETLNAFPIEYAQNAVKWKKVARFVEIGRSILLENHFASLRRLQRAADPEDLDAERFVSFYDCKRGLRNHLSVKGEENTYSIHLMQMKNHSFYRIQMKTYWGNRPRCFAMSPQGISCRYCRLNWHYYDIVRCRTMYFCKTSLSLDLDASSEEVVKQYVTPTNCLELSSYFKHPCHIYFGATAYLEAHAGYQPNGGLFELRDPHDVIDMDLAREDDIVFMLRYVDNLAEMLSIDLEYLEQAVMFQHVLGQYNPQRAIMIHDQQRRRELARQEAEQDRPIRDQVEPPEEEDPDLFQ